MKHRVVYPRLNSKCLMARMKPTHSSMTEYCKNCSLSTDVITERRGRLVNTPASYSEVPGSNLGPETSYPDKVFVVFLCPFRRILG
jgi:hypothetical protein